MIRCLIFAYVCFLFLFLLAVGIVDLIIGMYTFGMSIGEISKSTLNTNSTPNSRLRPSAPYPTVFCLM